MTKFELIEAIKHFPDDMPIKIKVLQCMNMQVHNKEYEWDNCDIESVHKCYHHKGDFILIEL